MSIIQASRVREEYLPDDPSPADSPGSQASRQAWQTAKDRAVAEAKKAPFELRNQAFYCNDAGLSTFAKLLFDRLTDMAFEPAFRRGDGVVAASKKLLADQAGKSVDTVTRATRQLEKAGFIWTKTRWSGSFEITWWYIREWADDSAEYDPASGSNFGRRMKTVQRNTLRGTGGRFAANPASMRARFRAWMASNRQAESPGSTVKAEISPDHGQESALTGLTSQRGQGRPVSPDHPQKSALTGRRNQPCQDGEISPDKTVKSALTSGKNQPRPAAPMPGLNTLKSSTGEGEGEKGGASPPLGSDLEREFKAWTDGLIGSFPSRLEKLRTRLSDQRRAMKPSAARDFLDRKLAFLNGLLDGPLPPYEPSQAKTETKRPVPVSKRAKVDFDALRKATL